MTAAAVKHLLVASDGSEYSSGACSVAIDMARQCGARLTAMAMVLLSDDLEGVGTHDLIEQQDRTTQARLDVLAADARHAGVLCDTDLRHGERPHAEIVAAAEDIDADLIVMGRRGRRGLARLMIGDATARVIGSSSCHVLVVPRGVSHWHNRILLATDGSAHSNVAADTAIALALACRLPLTVVSAVVASHNDARRADAQKAVEVVCRRAAILGIACQAETGEGQPNRIIVDTARKTGADLIVLGSHGRSNLSDILLGSVSERVINAAECPVLVARV